MRRNLLFVTVCFAVIAAAVVVFVARQSVGRPTATTPVATSAKNMNSRTPVAGHGTPPAAPVTITKPAVLAAAKSDASAAAAPTVTAAMSFTNSAAADLEKIVAGLTREQATKLQQAASKREMSKQFEDRKYNLPIENSLRRMDIAFHQRDLALSVDQLAKLDAVKQNLNTQMEEAGIIDLVEKGYAFAQQGNDILKGLNQPDLTPEQRQQIKDQARVPFDQAMEIGKQVNQAKAPVNQLFIDAARGILTPEQNQALDKLLGTPRGPG